MVVRSPSLNNRVSFTNRAGRYSQGTMGNPPMTKLAMAWNWSSLRASGQEQTSDGC
jgi:hypothetical protein